MTKTDIIQILFFSLPEALAIVSLASFLAGSKLPWRKILIMGILVGFLSHSWRIILSNYILNIFSYILILLFFLSFYKVGFTLLIRAISIMLAVSIYLVVEFINLKMFVLFGLNPEVMLAKPAFRYVCFGVQIASVIFILNILKYFNFFLFNRSSYEND